MNVSSKSLSLAVIGTIFVAGCASQGEPYQPYGESSAITEPSSQPETIQVVGSRLKRTVDPDNPNLSTLSPVSVITNEQMQRRGYNNLCDAVSPMINFRGAGGC